MPTISMFYGILETAMYPSVKSVKPLADYKLLLVFDDGARRIFDVTPMVDKGGFSRAA